MTRGNQSYWYVFEAIGSVRQLTDTQSQVPDAYFYDAWGNELTSPHSQVPNPFRYVGKYSYYLDTQSALMLLGVRYYQAGVGRFMTIDPLKVKNNWYAYASNRPTMLIDPNGKIPILPPIYIFPPFETFFRIGISCFNSCPYINMALDLIWHWTQSNLECAFLYKGMCQIDRTPQQFCVPSPGGRGRMDCGGVRPYTAMIRCRRLGPNIAGRSPGCGEIEINIDHPGCRDPNQVAALARTIIHEIAHSCFWCGNRPYRPLPRFIRWQCPYRCDREWSGPDVLWETCAELLAHKCSGRRDL
ncbi:RHS repeat-associated core domain-containing protein [Candidatus Fervidibacteria bacterium JGI MDM2 JNZ-1-D12]